MKNKTTFKKFMEMCEGASFEIVSMKFDGGCKGRVEAVMSIKGTFLEISYALKKITKSLKPFIGDKYFGKWLNISGTMDLHEFDGRIIIEVGFRGIGIEYE